MNVHINLIYDTIYSLIAICIKKIICIHLTNPKLNYNSSCRVMDCVYLTQFMNLRHQCS